MPKFMIHTYPMRLWYVNEFLIPSMLAQGIKMEDITVWNDIDRKGNLAACMEAFDSCTGYGDTWHLQDDVAICRDFAERIEDIPAGHVVYGFCNRYFRDEPTINGEVYAEDMWHSFQCVRIPNKYARECVAWLKSGAADKYPEACIVIRMNKGDDTVFREFFIEQHGRETVFNIKPNLVEHIDYMMGGSAINQWRSHPARSELWDDEDLLKELKEKLRKRGF